jgi:hypothetical protein
MLMRWSGDLIGCSKSRQYRSLRIPSHRVAPACRTGHKVDHFPDRPTSARAPVAAVHFAQFAHARLNAFPLRVESGAYISAFSLSPVARSGTNQADLAPAHGAPALYAIAMTGRPPSLAPRAIAPPSNQLLPLLFFVLHKFANSSAQHQ